MFIGTCLSVHSFGVTRTNKSMSLHVMLRITGAQNYILQGRNMYPLGTQLDIGQQVVQHLWIRPAVCVCVCVCVFSVLNPTFRHV